MTARPAAHSDAHEALALDSIRAAWYETYDVGYVADMDGFPDGAYLARRLTGGALLLADTPAGLDSAIRADWARLAAR